MESFFGEVLKGYRTENTLRDERLEQLPLMLQTVLMENIIDEFETQKAGGLLLECDGEQAYRIKCSVEEIPFMGFFSESYDIQTPFEL